MSGARRVYATLAALVLVPAALALFLPSYQPHSDSFDDLLALAQSRPPTNWKHPLAEPVVWALLHLTGRASPPDSLRVVQLWNACFFVLALVAIYAIAIRRKLGITVAAVTVALVATTFSALHFLRDPYLFYIPPSLALLGAEAYLISIPPSRTRIGIAIGFGVLAALINPLTAPAAIALFTTRRRVVAFSIATAAVAALPIVAVALSPAARAVDPTIGVLYGMWRPNAIGEASTALSYALLSSPGFPGELDALVRGVGLFAMFGLGAFAIARVVRAPAPLAKLPLALAVVGHIVVVTWWDPAQTHFWLLPPYVFAIAFVSCALPDPEPDPPLRAAVVLALAAAVVSNGTGYVARTSRGVDPQRELALRLSERLRPVDIAVFREIGSQSLLYYANLQSTGFLSLVLDGAPGQKSFDRFLDLYAHVQRQRGKLYVETDRQGRIVGVPGEFDRSDLARLSFGVTLRFEPFDLREVRVVMSEPPCRSAKRGAPVSDGRSVAARQFEESDLNRYYAPERALDGEIGTEWLSNDLELTWLDVFFDPPRSATEIRVLNARNRPHLDHASRRYRIEAWRESDLVADKNGEFETPRTVPGWQMLPLPDAPIDCVRFIAFGRFRRGVGLAELQVR